MKTKIFGGIAILAIALAVAFNVSLNTGKTNNASLLALANVEALAQSEGTTGSNTFQIGSKKITKSVKKTNEAGWSWDVGLNVWLLNGSVSKNAPTTSYEETEEVTVKCCRDLGDLTSCSFEKC